MAIVRHVSHGQPIRVIVDVNGALAEVTGFVTMMLTEPGTAVTVNYLNTLVVAGTARPSPSCPPRRHNPRERGSNGERLVRVGPTARVRTWQPSIRHRLVPSRCRHHPRASRMDGRGSALLSPRHARSRGYQ